MIQSTFQDWRLIYESAARSRQLRCRRGSSCRAGTLYLPLICRSCIQPIAFQECLRKLFWQNVQSLRSIMAPCTVQQCTERGCVRSHRRPYRDGRSLQEGMHRFCAYSTPLHIWYLSVWETCFSSRFPEPSPVGTEA